MPLVRTPMIAPTKIYDNVPTLMPEEAADMIVQACIYKPVRVATRLGVFGEVLHAAAPRVAQIVMNTTFRMFPDSAAAKGDKRAKPALSPEAMAMQQHDARHPLLMRRHAALLAAVLAGCATLAGDALDQRYGAPDPARYDTAVAPVGVSYRDQVQPILNRRCVVCHGCYDAPCQIKLGAWAGVARGGSTEAVYDAGRLRAAEPSRLFVDAHGASQWRTRGFYPVLNERRPDGDLAASLLYRSLALKQQHPLPAQPVLGDEFDFSLGRDNACPRIEQYDAFAARQPLAGMPYGLPGLNAGEMATITRWLQGGAGDEGERPLSALQREQVMRWEHFLNGATAKQRLMSRYLYEHLFLGHLHFEGDPQRTFFRIVRSRTPPGQPVEPVATRRPYDDPGVAVVHYRLVPERESLVAKTHMPYALGDARLAKYTRWFLDADYRVDTLPGYAVAVASNPFVAFKDIPVDSRYRFMLDEAQFFIMNFIKGPVCRGQMAVDVIQDHFWVFFVDPQASAHELRADSLLRQSQDLQLPAALGSDAGLLLPWLHFARLERDYLQRKSEAITRALAAPGARLDLSLVWPGDGGNRNAALTVFRHFDNASVVQGLVGEPPKTAWIIGYALFERIYYLLAAGYDVYGNVGHQLNSRLYMDFMRMEGESNFIGLLPQALRRPTAERWYEGAGDEAREYVYGRLAHVGVQSAVAYRSDDPQRELYTLLRQRLAPVLDARYDTDGVADASLRAPLRALAGVRGASLQWLPEMSLLRVRGRSGQVRHFTLLRNTAHANVAHLAREKPELRPADDTLTVAHGFIGAYPNAIYQIDEAELPAFAAALRTLDSQADYRSFADRFALRRTAKDFWAASDALHDAYQRWSPVEAALFDYNRLENR